VEDDRRTETTAREARLVKTLLPLAAVVLAAACEKAPASGPSAEPTPPPVAALPELVPWIDPVEHAFTVDVPKGWTIGGGTHRNAPMDARNFVNAQSPDGKIKVWVDDPNVLPHQEPHRTYEALGWHEGAIVQGPAGPLMIERFRSGAQFAADYAVKRLCPRPQTLAAFDLRNETQREQVEADAMARKTGFPEQASAGEYVFRCGEQSGYVYAVTVLARSLTGGPQIWGVTKLASFLADPSEADVARYTMNAMRASFRLDPAWEARYQQQIHDITGAVIEESNRITRISMEQARRSMEQNMRMVKERQRQFDQMNDGMMSSFKRRMDSSTANTNKWSDVILGQVHGCDDLGRCATVSNDYQHHWTDPSGNVVGGPSDGSAPGPQYRPWTPDAH
jgi:hypothetical protein